MKEGLKLQRRQTREFDDSLCRVLAISTLSQGSHCESISRKLTCTCEADLILGKTKLEWYGLESRLAHPSSHLERVVDQSL